MSFVLSVVVSLECWVSAAVQSCVLVLDSHLHCPTPISQSSLARRCRDFLPSREFPSSLVASSAHTSSAAADMERRASAPTSNRCLKMTGWLRSRMMCLSDRPRQQSASLSAASAACVGIAEATHGCLSHNHIRLCATQFSSTHTPNICEIIYVYMYKINRKIHNKTNVTPPFARHLIVHWSN